MERDESLKTALQLLVDAEHILTKANEVSPIVRKVNEAMGEYSVLNRIRNFIKENEKSR